MKITAAFVMPHFRQLRPSLDRAMAAVCMKVARAAPKLQRDAIDLGQTPDVKKQKQNAKRTIARKGHSKPLIGEMKVLRDARRYKVAKIPHGASVMLPLARRRFVRRHRELGYDYWRVGHLLRYLTHDTIAAALAKVEVKAVAKRISDSVGKP